MPSARRTYVFQILSNVPKEAPASTFWEQRTARSPPQVSNLQLQFVDTSWFKPKLQSPDPGPSLESLDFTAQAPSHEGSAVSTKTNNNRK